MSGKAILVVGARGTGKTTTVKKMLAKVHKDARIVLDVNGEYTDLYPHPFIEFDAFAKKLVTVKDAFIVIEEATIFLSNRGYDSDVTSMLVKARHNRNTVILVYHSIRAIPKYIFDLCNVVILHKTNDNEKALKDKENDRLIEAFNELKNASMIKDTKTGKVYSPQKTIDLQV